MLQANPEEPAPGIRPGTQPEIRLRLGLAIEQGQPEAIGS